MKTTQQIFFYGGVLLLIVAQYIVGRVNAKDAALTEELYTLRRVNKDLLAEQETCGARVVTCYEKLQWCHIK